MWRYFFMFRGERENLRTTLEIVCSSSSVTFSQALYAVSGREPHSARVRGTPFAMGDRTIALSRSMTNTDCPERACVCEDLPGRVTAAECRSGIFGASGGERHLRCRAAATRRGELLCLLIYSLPESPAQARSHPEAQRHGFYLGGTKPRRVRNPGKFSGLAACRALRQSRATKKYYFWKFEKTRVNHNHINIPRLNLFWFAQIFFSIIFEAERLKKGRLFLDGRKQSRSLSRLSWNTLRAILDLHKVLLLSTRVSVDHWESLLERSSTLEKCAI